MQHKLGFDVQRAITCALATIDRTWVPFGGVYPDDTTTGNVYRPRRVRDGFAEGGNFGWTTAFVPGMLWLAFQLTGNDKYRWTAEQHVENFVARLENNQDLDTHDLGFLYTLACVVPWQLTGNPKGRQGAVRAAQRLITRYSEAAGIIQAWGNLNNPGQRGRTIIDSLMNMPLLYWASRTRGEPRLAQIARRHTAALAEHIVRPDNSTYHTFYWDPETGTPLRGDTHQGFADDSCWARGQTWGIYGFVLNYRYTRDETFLRTAIRCADYFLAHLPGDHVPYWDLIFTDDSRQERDSSAAAIAVCGLHELARQVPDAALRERYSSAAETILASLAENYATCGQPASDALLLHGVYNKPRGMGVDEGTLWGDYFYLEGLTRFEKPTWSPFW